MQLFKRILLSLFPDEIITQNVNPASMFVSFIASKEFFSVINRKIVENYRLNMFDIALDSFEFKVGFGDKPSLKLKDIDTYYGYCGTANINGYRFFNPANLSNAVALVSAVSLQSLFEKYPEPYFLHFLYTVYFLGFVFFARFKMFPYQADEENFNRFVQVLFEFWQYVCQQTGCVVDAKIFDALKKDILGQVDVCFMLFRYYYKLGTLLSHHDEQGGDLKTWLFTDDLQQQKYKNILADYIQYAPKYSISPIFSATEKKLLNLILPADVLLRYLFLDTDMFLMVEHVVSRVFDKDKLSHYFQQFRSSDVAMDDFLLYITDYRHFKHGFFAGLQKYVLTVFGNLSEADEELFDEVEDLNELMSSIGNDAEQLGSFKVPERIKKESQLMEKVLNFYVTFLGGFWVARGDSFYLRFTKKNFVNEILARFASYDSQPENLTYYGMLLYQYSKNIFYYKYATDNVRAGKQKFFVPYKSTYKKTHANLSIVMLFNEQFVYTLLQDFNVKDLKIYIKNKQILDFFKAKYIADIGLFLKQDVSGLIGCVYGDLDVLLVEFPDFSKALASGVSEQDVYNLKEMLYTVDFWIVRGFCKKLQTYAVRLDLLYSSIVVVGILATIKETLFGFLLYYFFLKQQAITQKRPFQEHLLLELYMKEVLGVAHEYRVKIELILLELIEEFSDVLHHWIVLDDNKAFMQVVLDNWQNFMSYHTPENFWGSLSGEDVIWFRGFLKNLTYYNKRFLIPK